MNVDKHKSPGALAHDHLGKGDPTGWFEVLYAASDTSGSGVPWAKMKPNQDLLNWLKENEINGAGKTALVVGCGLGDDAEVLARFGFDVTAFDVSESAIELCRQRFAESSVSFQAADLFAAPGAWQGAFDFVFESITVQSLPPELQDQAIEHIVQFVAPGGEILVMTSARQPDQLPGGPPWPISRDSLNHYLVDGIREVFLNAQTVQKKPEMWYIQALYRRPV